MKKDEERLTSEGQHLLPPKATPQINKNYGLDSHKKESDNRRSNNKSPETDAKRQSTKDNDYDSEDEDDDEVVRQTLLLREKDFTIDYDAQRGYRGTELKPSSFARPHMRSFHASWICFFASFFTQFAMAPLLPVIGESLNLSKSDVWHSNCLMMVGGIPMRFILGPLCDKYGARLTMTTMLGLCGMVCGLSGLLVVNVASLTWTRFIIGGKPFFLALEE